MINALKITFFSLLTLLGIMLLAVIVDAITGSPEPKSVAKVLKPKEQYPDTVIIDAINGSDDFEKHKAKFIEATRKLLTTKDTNYSNKGNPICTLQAFDNLNAGKRGWSKSTTHDGYYYAYCSQDEYGRFKRVLLHPLNGNVYNGDEPNSWTLID